MSQNTHHILMIRPVRFSFNEQTAGSNAFQQSTARTDDTHEKALKEFDGLVDLLRQNNVQVWVVDDTEDPHTPDSIFPNNWISMHEDSRIAVYPMQAENRRQERRADIVHHLSEVFYILDIEDYTLNEQQGKFLEGTGSMVLDRINKICYACVSPRTHIEPLKQFCKDFNYQLIDFIAKDANGTLIYHTNVVMCVGENFIVACMDAIPDLAEREKIRRSTSKPVIEISMDQLNHFAGNMLEVINEQGEHLLVMSEQAYQVLTTQQIIQLEQYARIISAPLYTIEANGGGSARCMMAEIFLPIKAK